MFEVVLSPDASAFMARADQQLARRLARCFEWLERTPRDGNNIRRLSGRWRGYSRYRVGEWRVIYRIDDEEMRVDVVLIAHRRDVYDM